MLWIIKLTVTPLLVGAMSLAARAWGPTIGGLIMGLPWMTGPILFFFALDQGPSYTESMATGVELATVAIVGWALVLAAMAHRFGWALSLLAACATYVTVGVAISELPVPLHQSAVLAYAALLVGFTVLPRARTAAVPLSLPWWDIPARMLATFGLVSIILVASELLGPRLSGVVASYPVIMTVIGGFTLHRWGTDALLRLLRGALLSLNGFVTFFLIAGLGVAEFGAPLAFAIAALAAISVSLALVALARMGLLPP